MLHWYMQVAKSVRKWCLPEPLFLEKSPNVPVPQAQGQRLVKNSLLYIPGIFKTTVSMLYLLSLFVVLSLLGQKLGPFSSFRLSHEPTDF